MAVRLVALLLAACVLLFGCSESGPASVASSDIQPSPSTQTAPVRRVETAQQIAARLQFHLADPDPVRSLIQTAPASFDDAQWGGLQAAAVQGGYNLRPYAGEALTFAAYPIVERDGGRKQTLWMIESGGQVVGAYISVAGMDPGISGVGNPQ